MPVCGCDDVTYSNACALCNGSLAYDGVCNGDIGGMCGGIAGFQCVEGAHCELEGDFPDAAGICVEDATDSCSNHCDGQSEDGTCWCDEACVGYGDCCADINTFCG
ncbi:MAG: hypothetical protein JKY37_01890 [Nannocystaceae bacterium]|nr:hypothetical protein [Nannocystaceae bacterium]